MSGAVETTRRREMTDTARPDSRARRARHAVPLHGCAGRRDRGPLAGPVGRRGNLRGAQPGRPAGRAGQGRSPAEALCAGHVPVPVRHRAARRAPAGLHRHRRARPVQADDRAQRAARAGLRRVRPARRAVRRADRPAPAGHHRGEHRDDARAAAPAGTCPRPRGAASPPPTPSSTAGPSGSSCRSTTAGTTTRPAAPARSPSWSRCWPPAPAGAGGVPGVPSGPVGRPGRAGAPPGRRRAPAGLPVALAGQLVPRPGHGAGQRGGHRRGTQRPRQLPGLQARPAPVDDADHGLRRAAAGRPGPAGLAGVDQAAAAQLDRPLRGRAGPVPQRRRRDRGLHDPPGHAVRRHLHGRRARAPDARPAGLRRLARPTYRPPGPAGRRRRATRSRPTAGPPSCAPTWSGRPRAGTRPASSPAPTPPTRSPARRSRSSSPTTC